MLRYQFIFPKNIPNEQLDLMYFDIAAGTRGVIILHPAVHAIFTEVMRAVEHRPGEVDLFQTDLAN